MKLTHKCTLWVAQDYTYIKHYNKISFSFFLNRKHNEQPSTLILSSFYLCEI